MAVAASGVSTAATGASIVLKGWLSRIVRIENATSADVTGWRGPYLKSDIPLDPWGHAYVYEFPGKVNATGYDIRSMGPDGQANTQDDVVNASISAK